MIITILGGGGNVAEALVGLLEENGHSVFQFRFTTQVKIPGVPARPVRDKSRLDSTQLINNSGASIPVQKKPTVWASLTDLQRSDCFLFAFPSYMIAHVEQVLGHYMAGKVFINLSDRFLGTYDLLARLHRKRGAPALPKLAVAFNGTPVMALKSSRDGPNIVYFKKLKHNVASFPHNSKLQALDMLSQIFAIEESAVIFQPSMMHLAFENTHCIEHAVFDLVNLERRHYDSDGKLYSQSLYQDSSLRRLDGIVSDRDRIAKAVVGQQFLSLKEYDERIFGTNAVNMSELAGKASFRIEHPNLSQAPALQSWAAFGYEDIGWSLVTLESFGRFFGVDDTLELSALIDEWCIFGQCDYRYVGRSISSLGLLDGAADSESLPRAVDNLKWVPGTLLDINQGNYSHSRSDFKVVAESSLHLRSFNKADLLAPEVIQYICAEFKSVVPRLFGNNLVFGFVFGGFAKGYAVKNQDADFFVCLREEDEESVQVLRKWYFDIHQRFGLAADMEHPCSLTTLKHLREKLSYARQIRLENWIEHAYTKQAIVWADVVMDAKAAVIGHTSILRDIEEMCQGLSQKWRGELLELANERELRGVEKLPLTRLFRQVVRYGKIGNECTKPDQAGDTRARL